VCWNRRGISATAAGFRDHAGQGRAPLLQDLTNFIMDFGGTLTLSPRLSPEKCSLAQEKLRTCSQSQDAQEVVNPGDKFQFIQMFINFSSSVYQISGNRTRIFMIELHNSYENK
jgi:hypothetical protein